MSLRCTRGTVMVETLIAFVPLFTLFLGIVQYALLAAAQLVIHHAAVAGVRSASVVLDDDPARYERTERLSIAGSETQGSANGAVVELAGVILSDLPAMPNAPHGLAAGAARSDGPRTAPIRNAVYAKLAAIVPSRALAMLSGRPGTSVLHAFGESPGVRLVQAPLYLPVTTAIAFPREPGSRELFEGHIDAGRLVTVRVTHMVMCTVPLVAALMCGLLADRERAPREELRRAPAAEFQDLLEATGSRTTILQAEASMPFQHAPYAYASQTRSTP